MKSGKGLVHYDEDRYNFQSDNIGMRNNAKNLRKKMYNSDGEEEEDYD